MERKNKICTAEELLPILEEVINSGGAFPLTVTGTSMTPTLYPLRDTVNLVSPQVMPLKKYDIVLFKRDNGKIVLHRVKKLLSDNKLLINGDSQIWTEVIKSKQVIAVAKSYSKNGNVKKCRGAPIRLYAALWCTTRPFRPLIFKISKMLHNNN